MLSAVKKGLLIVLLFSVLVGCGISNGVHKGDSTIKLASLDNAFNIDEVYDRSYDNLIIEPGIQPQRVDKIESSVYMIPDYEEYIYQNYDKIFRNLIGKAYNKKYVDTSDSYYPYGARLKEEDKLYIALGCDGFFIWENEDALKSSHSYNSDEDSLVEAIYQSTRENGDVEFKVGSDTILYDDVCSYINVQRKRILDAYGISFDSSSHICDIYQMVSREDNQPYVYANMAQTIDGIDIASIANHYPDGNDSSYTPWIEGGIYIIGKDRPGEIKLHGMGVLLRDDESDTQSVKQIISCADAVQRFSKYLSEDLKYSVKDIRLEYRAKRIGNDQEDNPDKNKGKKKHRQNADWSLSCSYDKFRMDPSWAIYLDQTPDKEIVGYVDCRTGETEFICNQK